MLNVNDLKKGNFIIYEGDVLRVIKSTKHFTARGSGLVRTRFKNIKNGLIKEISFSSGEKVEEAVVNRRDAQYLYNDSEFYHFMTLNDYEQFSLSIEDVGDDKYYLIENMELNLIFFDGNPISLDLPITVELEVSETEPNFKGNTVSGSGKPAILETGLRTTVPFFVEQGQKIKVDTRTGDYLERA